MPNEHPQFKLAYTVAELSKLTGCGRDAIYEAIRDNRLKAVKRGRSTRFLHIDVEAWLGSLPQLKLGPDDRLKRLEGGHPAMRRAALT